MHCRTVPPSEKSYSVIKLSPKPSKTAIKATPLSPKSSITQDTIPYSGLSMDSSTRRIVLVTIACIPQSLLKGKRSLPEIMIDQAHNTLGHLGAQKTSEYTHQWFWWPRMGREIEKFCLSCENCQMSKSSNQLKPGLLHNLPIPRHPRQSIGMDFVSPFPECQGYDYLWVIICQLTNQTHLTPITVRTTTTDLAQ